MSAFPSRDRIVPAIATVVLQLLLGYVLIVGLGVAPMPRLADSIAVFDVPPVVKPPPAPKPVPKRARTPRPRGAAAPPNIRSRATPVVAPPPVIKLTRPPLIVAAPLPGIGADPTAGAAPVAGPGSGAGGQGTGTGSGSSGTGDGGGGTPARFLSANIRGDRDYPRAAKAAGFTGTVTTSERIGADGRVKACRVTRSSGNADLDEQTCRLVVARFRYAPARDASGRKVEDTVTEEHHWGISDAPRRDGGRFGDDRDDRRDEPGPDEDGPPY